MDAVKGIVDDQTPLVRALIGLTVVTGLVDAISFLGLGHIFTANMTGNLVFLGFSAGGAPGISAARSIAALCAFAGGSACGGRLTSSRQRTPVAQMLIATYVETAGRSQCGDVRSERCVAGDRVCDCPIYRAGYGVKKCRGSEAGGSGSYDDSADLDDHRTGGRLVARWRRWRPHGAPSTIHSRDVRGCPRRHNPPSHLRSAGAAGGRNVYGRLSVVLSAFTCPAEAR
jgi:hypothetical protein